MRRRFFMNLETKCQFDPTQLKNFHCKNNTLWKRYVYDVAKVCDFYNGIQWGKKHVFCRIQLKIRS